MSYQQLQKYESGRNRVSARMMHEVGVALSVPVGKFFEGLPSQDNAAHHLVAELDARLLKALDVERFLKNALWAYLDSSQRPNERIEQTRMRRAISVWGKDPVDRPGAV